MSGKFRHEEQITSFLEKQLTTRYGAKLKEMKTHFKSEFKTHEASIGFRFDLGAFVFDLWISWRDDRGLSAALWEVNGGDKAMVRQWFTETMQNALPQLKSNHLRRYDFVTLEDKPFISGQVIDELQTLKEFEAMQERILTAVIGPLASLYQKMLPLVEQLNHWLDQLIQRLRITFPPDEGWTIERKFLHFEKFGMILITRAEWAPHFSICIESENSMLRSLLFGIRRKVWRGGFSGQEDVIFRHCQEEMFSDNPNPGSHGKNDWWIYWNVPAPYRSPLEGDFISDGSYISTKAEECLNGIVEGVGRFKQARQIMDQLARLSVVEGIS